MHLTLLAITGALFFIASSNALSVDSFHHLARHQHIAARHPAVKRASVSARCKKRNSTSTTAPSSTLHPTYAPPASSSSHAPPSSSSQAPPSSPSSGSGKGKVGIAWAYHDGDDAKLKNFITNKVSTVYTWSPKKPQNTYGLQFAPMLWGAKQIGDFQSLVNDGYAKYALGFNEPDLPASQHQSNLDPATAAQLWKTHIQPLKDQGYQLITPAIAYNTQWLRDFFAACTDCTFHHMALHVYSTSSQNVIEYLTDAHNTFGMSIWVTEFACQSYSDNTVCTEDQVFAFMATLIKWMDETEWIVKYFYYGVMNPININPVNALMDVHGMPTKLGRLYIGS